MKRAVAAAAAVLFLLSGCGSDGSPSNDAEGPASTDRVTLPKSYKFQPATISVAAGTTVTWTNEDDFPHDVTLLDGAKETIALSIGKSGTITFSDPGTFRYECSLHPQQMKGTVVVT